MTAEFQTSAPLSARFAVQGKRALVTGGSKGIGAEAAIVLAQAGADVAIVGRDEAGLAETAAQVVAAGRRCIPIVADMGSVAGPQAAADAALAAFGGIDILVNNAGIARIAPLLELSADAWDETMAVNMRAPFLLARALAPAMIAQRRGKIINVSSQAGAVALDGHGAYCTSKGGLNLLTKVMALELAPQEAVVETRVVGDEQPAVELLLHPIGEVGEARGLGDHVVRDAREGLDGRRYARARVHERAPLVDDRAARHHDHSRRHWALPDIFSMVRVVENPSLKSARRTTPPQLSTRSPPTTPSRV